MPVTKFNTEAMEQCRTTVSGQAGQFGAVGDGFANRYANADIYGKLSSSSGLSGAVSGLDQAAATEFAAAETLLGKVERALDAIQQSVANAEDANVNSFRAV